MPYAFCSRLTGLCAVLVFLLMPLAGGYAVQAAVALGAGSLTVTGWWTFPGRDGIPTADQMTVEMVRGDTGERLASCISDLTGAFTCGPFPNPGAAGVRARLLTNVRLPPAGDVLVVVNPDIGVTAIPENAYAVTAGTYQLADGVQNIGVLQVPAGDPALHAFWVEQDLLRAWRYFGVEAGAQQIPPQTAGSLVVEWKSGSTQATRIELPGRVYLSDSGALSSSVVNHQYGHALMYRAYAGSFPGEVCADTLDARKTSTPGCAWTEGWADFFSVAVNHAPVYHWENGASLNLETPTRDELGWDDGDAVEGRVAGALWDLLDAARDGNDNWSEGKFLPFWQVLFNRPDSTFHDFWINWLASGRNYSSAVRSIDQNAINYYNPLPTITSLSPASMPQAVCGFELTVHGTNFIPNWTKVYWKNSYISTTFVSPTELRAAITADDIASAGSASVTVYSAEPGGGESNALTFTIDPVAAITPRIERLSPNPVHVGGSVFPLLVQGCGFVDGSRVFWNGSERYVQSVSSSLIRVTILAADIGVPGSAQITVTNPLPGGATSDPATLRVLPPQPVIAALEPLWVFTGSKDIALGVRGAQFTPETVVLWDGQALSTTVISPFELTATVPSSLLGSPHMAQIVVDSSGTGDNLSAAAVFQVYAPVFLPYLGR